MLNRSLYFDISLNANPSIFNEILYRTIYIFEGLFLFLNIDLVGVREDGDDVFCLIFISIEGLNGYFSYLGGT